MSTAARFFHDTYASLARRLKWTLPVCAAMPGELKRTLLVPAGACVIDTALEESFHGYPAQGVPYAWPDWKCTLIPEARVVGDQGFVFLPDGRLLVPTLFPNDDKLHIFKVRRPIKLGAQRVKGMAFHLTGSNHENRGHFMLDHLPRLIAAEEMLRGEKDWQIILTGHHISWQREYLQMLGFDPARIVACESGTLIVERLLHVPFVSTRSSVAPSFALNRLRDAGAEYAGVNAAQDRCGPPVFLSRRDAPNRRVLNEQRLYEIACEFLPELQLVLLTGMTLSEQIRLYRHTPLFISPLGQASCNMVFGMGNTIINLTHGPQPKDAAGCVGTHIAALSGNRGLTLHSGTDLGVNKDWSFPEAAFAQQMKRFVETVNWKK